MGSLLTILLGVAMAAVVLVLVTGLLAFAKGGEFHQRNANRLMNLRVGAQAVAILVFIVIAFLQ